MLQWRFADVLPSDVCRHVAFVEPLALAGANGGPSLLPSLFSNSVFIACCLADGCSWVSVLLLLGC